MTSQTTSRFWDAYTEFTEWILAGAVPAIPTEIPRIAPRSVAVRYALLLLSRSMSIFGGMFEPLKVKARFNYRLWIRYSNGEEGEVELSHLAGQDVFKLCQDEQTWKNVRIAEDGGPLERRR